MDPLIMEFTAISVIVDSYKLRGIQDFRSGYTVIHSQRVF